MVALVERMLELNKQKHAVGAGLRPARGQVADLALQRELDSPEHWRMRARLRSPTGQARYRRRQALVEPVIGILKEQRGMRRFRLRALSKVGVEVALLATAFNLTRMWRCAARA